jgi:cytidylate kinase
VCEQGDSAAAAALVERDRLDAAQTLQAPDAVAIDSTELDSDAVVERVVALAREAGA